MKRLQLHKGRQQPTASVFCPIQDNEVHLHLLKSTRSSNTKVAFLLGLNRGVGMQTREIADKRHFEMQLDTSTYHSHLQPFVHLIASIHFVVGDHQLMCRQ